MRSSLIPCTLHSMHFCEVRTCVRSFLCILRYLRGSTFRPGEKWREQPSAPTPCFATRGYGLSMHALTALLGLRPPLREAQKVVRPPDPRRLLQFRAQPYCSTGRRCVCVLRGSDCRLLRPSGRPWICLCLAILRMSVVRKVWPTSSALRAPSPGLPPVLR